ncbi:pseudouridine synthase [Nannochloropsis oceanica]
MHRLHASFVLLLNAISASHAFVSPSPISVTTALPRSLHKEAVVSARPWALPRPGIGLQTEGGGGGGGGGGVKGQNVVQTAAKEEEEIIEFKLEGKEGTVPLDILLVRRFPALSRRACRRLLQDGKVRVNGQVITRLSKIGRSTGSVSVTMPTLGTLLHGVMHHLVSSSEEPCEILASPTQGLVHRLDKDTSGVWLCGKTKAAASRLSSLFKSRGMVKTYLALVHGDPCRGRKGEIIVEQPIFRKSNGKMAVPNTEIVTGRPSALPMALEGGRERGREGGQREEEGHPVLGDDVYCAADFTNKNRHLRKLGLKRVLLHAYSLSFLHPFSKTTLNLLAPLPRDMLSAIHFMLQGKGSRAGKEDEERKLKLLRLLRDGKPLTSVLDSDMASPVPILIKTAKDEEEYEEEWEDEVEEAEGAEEAE